MTIYSTLLELGYTDEQIRGAVDKDLNTQTFGLSVVDTPDGWPIVGISYRCDYKAEEEYGVADMAKNINGQKNQLDKIKLLHNGYMSFQATYTAPTDSELSRAVSHFHTSYVYAQGAKRVNRWHTSVKDMRAEAKTKGINLRGATKRDDIESALQAHDIETSIPTNPNRWPGWFQTGRVLVLRAKTGIVRDVLALILRAAMTDSVGVSAGGGPFSSGFGFYDTADIGPKLSTEIADETAWYNKQMEYLSPVRKALEDKGHKFIFLGNPSNTWGMTKYWLNGSVTKLVASQPFGWYTLDELRTEKFVEDARLYKIERDKQFDEKGKYRPEYLASIRKEK